ncbi:hypothetical protein MMC25_000984 [Agyrium rufum]|nr:hypothetical protein [Agyrium rufum]
MQERAKIYMLEGSPQAFLLFENLDQSTWLKTLEDSRSAYSSLREHFLRYIESTDDMDPLADDENSPWNILRRDEVIRAEIFQDIERCMPENLYFREPVTQARLLDILFIYSKLNADTGYRQGMHELLAYVLWVVDIDSIDPESTNEEDGPAYNDDTLLKAALEAQYVEHDAFTLFCIIMQNAKSSYELGDGGNQSNSPIVARSNRILEDYLHAADPELAAHLVAVEILPQIFLIRWIRLLFGREFPFDDILLLWDILFAEDPTLSMVDLICVAMLLRIRWQLLDADYSSALTLVLRYPVPAEPHGASTFVDDAVFLRQNLSEARGEYLIHKYTGQSPQMDKPETGRQSSHPQLAKARPRLQPANSNDPDCSNSPRRSPARFLQERGGVEGIIQEAAKGVYSRGERWGVNKAFRDALQNIQSGAAPPAHSSDLRQNSTDPKRLASRVKALEERNKALAKMLGNAMEDLWNQQKIFEEKKQQLETDALSVAIAKVQFVQVYLEDSSIPLISPAMEDTNDETVVDASVKAIEGAVKSPAVEEVTPSKPPQRRPTRSLSPRKAQVSKGNPSSDTKKSETLPTPPPSATVATQQSPEESTELAAKTPKTPKTPKPSTPPPLPSTPRQRSLLQPFHQPRPSLAQSSFSWMLSSFDSETQTHQPSFVASQTPSSEQHQTSPAPNRKARTGSNAARNKASFLFGDDGFDGVDSAGKDDGNGRRGSAASLVGGKKGLKKKSGRSGGDDGSGVILGEDGEDGEGFTLGTLKGSSSAVAAAAAAPAPAGLEESNDDDGGKGGGTGDGDGNGGDGGENEAVQVVRYKDKKKQADIS